MESAPVGRIKARESRAPLVHRQLREAILRGRIPAGTRLIESKLAEMMGVSRTPVREAVSRLESDGLIERLPFGGVVVRDLSAELVETFEIRQLLEGYAARLAAARITAEEVAELEDACKVGQFKFEDTSFEERAALNRLFHEVLAKASHNRKLIRLISECYEYAVTQETLPFYRPELARRHLAQHMEIVEALRARDGVWAERITRKHLDDVLRTIKAARKHVQEG